MKRPVYLPPPVLIFLSHPSSFLLISFISFSSSFPCMLFALCQIENLFFIEPFSDLRNVNSDYSPGRKGLWVCSNLKCFRESRVHRGLRHVNKQRSVRCTELGTEGLLHISHTAGCPWKFLVYVICFVYFFISDLFQFFSPSVLIFIQHFYVVLFNSFSTVFSLFPFFRQSVFSFTVCVSSHCICLSLPYASPSPCSLKPPTSCPRTVGTSSPVSLLSCPTRTAQWTRRGQKNWSHSFMR